VPTRSLPVPAQSGVEKGHTQLVALGYHLLIPVAGQVASRQPLLRSLHERAERATGSLAMKPHDSSRCSCRRTSSSCSFLDMELAPDAHRCPLRALAFVTQHRNSRVCRSEAEHVQMAWRSSPCGGQKTPMLPAQSLSSAAGCHSGSARRARRPGRAWAPRVVATLPLIIGDDSGRLRTQATSPLRGASPALNLLARWAATIDHAATACTADRT
jgi:hypothetical protein